VHSALKDLFWLLPRCSNKTPSFKCTQGGDTGTGVLKPAIPDFGLPGSGRVLTNQSPSSFTLGAEVLTASLPLYCLHGTSIGAFRIKVKLYALVL
jgi:hypothetical protein